MLPFKQAIHLPFDFCYGVRFIILKGKIILDAPSIYRGMVSIGAQGSDIFPKAPVIIDIRGKLIIKEGGIRIVRDCLIRIEEKGSIKIEKDVRIGAMSSLISEFSILIHVNTIFSWHCQIMDTDTHILIDKNTWKIYPRTQSVIIVKSCWIGNHVLINKGTKLPDNIIVASNSLCNKDYSLIVKEYSVFGGIPAKLIGENKQRHTDKL